MLKQITTRKELNKQVLEEFIKSYGENQYLYVIGIFYQQRTTSEFIFNQIFGYDLSEELDQQEKAVFTYKSEKDQYSNLIFLFTNFQFIDEFIFECSDVLINLDFTVQDGYQSLESYISKNLKERENPYVKKEINYMYPIDQDIKELDKKGNIDEQESQLINEINSNKGNVILRCLKQQEPKEIQESLVLKIQELEKYQMIPIPISKIATLFSIIWDNLLLNQNKNSLFLLKQIIVGSHFEEQWDFLVKEMQQWSKHLHIQCMEGVIHDFNIQNEEFRKISEKWKISSVFLKGFLQALDENYVKEQINQEIQKQIFKLFNFQLNYIKGNLNEIFQKKLTEIQNQEKLQQLEKLAQQQNQKSQQISQNQYPESQQPNLNQQLESSLLLQSPQFKNINLQLKEQSSNSTPSQTNQGPNISKFALSRVSSELNFSQIEIQNIENAEIQSKINDLSFSQDLMGLQRQNSNRSSGDLHNQTFGLLDASIVEEPQGQIYQIKEKSSEQESDEEPENQKLILKRVGSETFENSEQAEASKPENQNEINQNSSNQPNSIQEQNKDQAVNSPATNKSQSTGIQSLNQSLIQSQRQKNFKGSSQYFQIEKSQKIPNKLAYSQSPNIKQKSIERGRNSIRQNQQQGTEIQEYKLYEILEKTKNQVKIEIKTKMFDTLDKKSKEELEYITEYEQIEIQIIELITNVLVKRASLEVQDFVKQKIITRLKTDISDLFTNKDNDFWVKFKGIKNKIIEDQEKKIYEYLKDNFKLPKNNSNELIKKSKEVCLIEVKKLMKVKVEEIIIDFIQELQTNDKKVQDKQNVNTIYEKYEDFVIAFKDGLENDSGSNEEDLINQCNKILIDLKDMKDNYKNILKFKLNTMKLNFQKSIVKKERQLTSFKAFMKMNKLTLTLLVVFSILSLFENVPLASSIGIILITHVIYTIYKLK